MGWTDTFGVFPKVLWIGDVESKNQISCHVLPLASVLFSLLRSFLCSGVLSGVHIAWFSDEDIPVLFVYLQRFHTSVGDFLVLPLTTIHFISILIRNRYRNRFRLLFDQHFLRTKRAYMAGKSTIQDIASLAGV